MFVMHGTYLHFYHIFPETSRLRADDREKRDCFLFFSLE